MEIVYVLQYLVANDANWHSVLNKWGKDDENDSLKKTKANLDYLKEFYTNRDFFTFSHLGGGHNKTATPIDWRIVRKEKLCTYHAI